VTAGVVGVMLAGISLPALGLKFPSIVISYSRVFVDLFGWTGSELPMAIILCGQPPTSWDGDDVVGGLHPPVDPRRPGLIKLGFPS